jgi:LysM repeat protein
MNEKALSRRPFHIAANIETIEPMTSSMRARSIPLAAAWLLALSLAICVLIFLAGTTQARGKVRVLRPGETLADVALAWDTTPETLRWLNGLGARDVEWTGMKVKGPPREQVVAYVVVAGDTPERVASNHEMPLARLVEYNKISPNTRLQPGEVLLVDESQGFKATRELSVHIVLNDESAESIADLYQTSAKELLRVNRLNKSSQVTPGLRLLIPQPGLSQQLGKAVNDKNGRLMLSLTQVPSLTEKWVDVDLSQQRATAYLGTRPVKSFLISSGRSPTPTVKGVFRITAKISGQTMEGGSKERGDYYFVSGVKWVTYFHGGYSFHGAWWHNNFGHPMSHGCVNMRNEDAKWLYDWTSPTNPGRGWYSTEGPTDGTLVVVHD